MRRTFPTVPLFLLVSCAGYSQPADPKPAFEEVSVQASPPLQMLDRQNVTRSGMSGGPGSDDPGRFTATGIPLSSLILRAYGIHRHQLIGPVWLDTERYDITAKVPEGANREQFSLMLQSLLEKQLELKLHKDQREIATYELTVAKGGPKLTESVGAPPPPQPGGSWNPFADAADGTPEAAPPPGKPGKLGKHTDKDSYPILPPGIRSGGMVINGRATTRVSNMTMEQFAGYLTRILRRPVTDATGLQGKYDMTLHYVQEPMGRGGRGGLAVVGPNGVEPLPPALVTRAGPTLFGALQAQLGLHLESKMGMIDVLVVD